MYLRILQPEIELHISNIQVGTDYSNDTKKMVFLCENLDIIAAEKNEIGAKTIALLNILNSFITLHLSGKITTNSYF